MGQIARMGKHACSHDTSQNYLMKRMIDAIHATAKNQCGNCAGRKQKQHKKKGNCKKTKKSKKGKKHFKKKWMKNCKRIHGKNWKKHCRHNKPKPKPEEPSNPGDGTGDGPDPEPFVCD